MKFEKPLISGTLVKRYKRFFVDVLYKNKKITAHCPNSGSMKGLIDLGNKVYLSKSTNPKRKLRYTLEMISIKNKLVGVNTLKANKIVLEAFNKNLIEELRDFNIKPETSFDKDTRFDFLLIKNNRKCFVEVKNVTLSRSNKIAEFPDAITSRGTKHLFKLIEAKRIGYESFMIYLIQREDCNSFNIASDIDKTYALALKKAINSGIKILCYDCKLNPQEIKLNKTIKFQNEK